MTYDIEEIKEVLDKTHLREHLNRHHDFNYGDVSMITNYLPEGWDVSAGCTKCVIIPPEDHDYVIKIPFNTDYYEDDDSEEGYSPLEYGHLPLSDEYTGDYCAVEEEYSYLAEQEGVDEFFALTKCVGYVFDNTLPVYVQERCSGLNYSTPPSSPATRHTAKELKDKSATLYNFRTDFLEASVLVYGEEALKKLDRFIENWEVKDLHEGNYGYKYNTFIPKIFDFSGYDE